MKRRNRSQRFGLTLALVATAALGLGTGCSSSGGSPAVADAGADVSWDPGPVTCYDTKYPGVSPIDPDAPNFSDPDHTVDATKALFAKAKADNSAAYRAYKIAHDNPEALQCARCACGCARSLGHISAVDCFKDLHGFG
jgi:hypothetical protein